MVNRLGVARFLGQRNIVINLYPPLKIETVNSMIIILILIHKQDESTCNSHIMNEISYTKKSIYILVKWFHCAFGCVVFCFLQSNFFNTSFNPAKVPVKFLLVKKLELYSIIIILT